MAISTLNGELMLISGGSARTVISKIVGPWLHETRFLHPSGRMAPLFCIFLYVDRYTGMDFMALPRLRERVVAV